LAAFRNFGRSVDAASQVAPTNVNVLVNLSMNPPNQKIQNLAIESLRCLQQVGELEKVTKQLGGHEIGLLLGEANKFNFDMR